MYYNNTCVSVCPIGYINVTNTNNITNNNIINTNNNINNSMNICVQC